MTAQARMSAEAYQASAPRHHDRDETLLQEAMCQWLDIYHPRLIYFGSANGGKREISVAVQLKRMGVKAGVPDLEILLPDGRVLWIEVKTPTGVRNKAQKDLHPRMAAVGHHVHIARSIDDLEGILADVGIETRRPAR